MKTLPRLKSFHFSWKHLLVIFIILIGTQVFLSRLERTILSDLLSQTLEWYKKNSAEQIANLVTSSIEVFLEYNPGDRIGTDDEEVKKFVHALNSILKQPLMKRNVDEMCVILPYKNTFIAMDHGRDLYAYFYNRNQLTTALPAIYSKAVDRYAQVHQTMMKEELISIEQEGQNIFHVYVPLVPYGEYIGAVYLRIQPDVSSISQHIVTSFNKTVFVLSLLVFLGLLGLFYISTYTIVERDEAWEMLALEREAHAREQIAQKKERLFTKRIYHTHHKAEKVMGYICEDVEQIHKDNIDVMKNRIAKYANYIARVIYDMKWYTPPINTIRGPYFKTNLNDVLKFIVDNIFLRVSGPVQNIQFKFDLDPRLPVLTVNEFVVWELVEPLIQNSIEHSGVQHTTILLQTRWYPERGYSELIIKDNGKGIHPELLEKNEQGIKALFLENISTKEDDSRNCGYGCYLAYEIALRCGWELDAYNDENNGAVFTVKIYH